MLSPAKKLSADNENALREATDISNEAEDLYKKRELCCSRTTPSQGLGHHRESAGVRTIPTSPRPLTISQKCLRAKYNYSAV